jgi:hypothetical protein
MIVSDQGKQQMDTIRRIIEKMLATKVASWLNVQPPLAPSPAAYCLF